MRKLRQTLNKALDQCFLKVKLDTFHSAMPSISESHRDAIDDLGVQLMETLRLNIEVRTQERVVGMLPCIHCPL